MESFDGDIDETMLESSLGKVNHSVVFVTIYNLISFTGKQFLLSKNIVEILKLFSILIIGWRLWMEKKNVNGK